MERTKREIWSAFKIILLDGLRNPLSTLTMLVFYGFFYLIGYFLYGFTTNEVVSFQKYLISGFFVTSFLFQATGWWSFVFGDLKHYGQLEEVILSYSYVEFYLVGALIYASIATFLSIAIALISIYFLFGFPLFYIRVELFLVIIAFMVLSYFFSSLSNALFILFKENWVISNIASYLVIVITPIFYPMSFLPAGFQYISKLLPITWGAELLRSYMYDISEYKRFDAWLYFVATSLIWCAIAFRLWRRAYIEGKKTGQLYSI
jgi:ABC-type polysaccharide/polyol phosphate export permease